MAYPRDSGKEYGNYYNITGFVKGLYRDMEKRMETIVV